MRGNSHFAELLLSKLVLAKPWRTVSPPCNREALAVCRSAMLRIIAKTPRRFSRIARASRSRGAPTVQVLRTAGWFITAMDRPRRDSRALRGSSESIGCHRSTLRNSAQTG